MVSRYEQIGGVFGELVHIHHVSNAAQAVQCAQSRVALEASLYRTQKIKCNKKKNDFIDTRFYALE